MTFGEVFCQYCQPQIYLLWYNIPKCRCNVLHSDERTRLNCSMTFVTVFVSSDGKTFCLFTGVGCDSHCNIMCNHKHDVHTSETNNGINVLSVFYINPYMSTLRHSYGVPTILARLKTSVPETKISVI